MRTEELLFRPDRNLDRAVEQVAVKGGKHGDTSTHREEELEPVAANLEKMKMKESRANQVKSHQVTGGR